MPAPLPRFLFPALIPLLLAVPELQGQEAVVRVEENVRAEPNGTILGRLEPGTRLRVEERDGSWTRVVLEGFVWTRSLQVMREDGFDLVVAEPDGENFRDEPSGRIAARLVNGARLEEVERVPGWVRVRRVAWVWSASLEFRDAPAREAPEARPSPDEAAEDARPPSPPRDRWVRTPGGEPAILTAPDGDTLARARTGADLRVLAREGNWARVQLEGWVWLPEAEAPGELEVPVEEGLTAHDLTRDPEGYRGRVVELELQFISVERAERVRTDFYEGEPFLLTRAVDGDRVFVYVAIPPEFVEEAERYTPLERLMVVGRVRTGAAELTGNPLLELLEVERARR
jgi:hypothetical protein